MPTTYSSNYQIKLIGTGDEAGTWGDSTNQNLQRIEQALGQSLSIDPANAPTGSTSASSGNSWTMVWITTDTADAPSGAGSEGRARFVDFESSTVADNTTVQIRGSVSTEYPDRVYLVKNSLNGGHDLILNAGSGSDYTVKNGAYALIVAHGSAADGSTLTAETVLNALSELQVDNLLFPAAADITLEDNVAAALEIKGPNANQEFIRFDTSNDHLELAPGSGINTVEIDAETIDISSQNTDLSIRNGQTEAFEIFQGTNSYLKFDTSGKKIVVGDEASDVETLDISTDTIRVANQATDLRLNAGSSTALTVSDSNGTILTVDTSSEPEKIITASTTELEVLGTLDVDGTSDFSATSNFSATATFSSVDINGGAIDGTNIGAASTGTGRFSSLESTGTTDGVHLSSADSYASFGATAGSGGHGVRDNSGVLEVRNTNSDAWGQPYHVGMVSGQGAYFKSAANLALGTGNLAVNVASQEAHSLGSVPRIIQARLVCTSTDNGYAAGDEVFPPTFELNNTGFTFGCNTDYVFFNTGSVGLIYLPPKTGGGQVALTLSRWDLFLHAWA